jgi:hypothetical protein
MRRQMLLVKLDWCSIRTIKLIISSNLVILFFSEYPKLHANTTHDPNRAHISMMMANKIRGETHMQFEEQEEKVGLWLILGGH